MDDLEPVRLQEDGETGDRFLVYGTDSGVRVEMRYEGDGLWVTQAQIAELFGRDRSTITRHINKIFKEGELEAGPNVQKTHLSPGSRPLTLYNLDMVISVGYRVASKQATLFRRWATDKLVQFATKGFVIDSARLKNPENADRLAELREIIRDIRSDEANVYRELRKICAMCQDYDGTSESWHEFYRNTQAKLIFAVTSNTPAELLKSRANAAIDNMGLTNWQNDNIRKTDVTTSKSYLADRELKELNRLTVILLDIFEDQVDIGKLITMKDVETLLDSQLNQLNRVVLRHGGKVSMASAKKHAELQYDKYKLRLKASRQAHADQFISEIKAVSKTLPKVRASKATG